MIGKMYVVFGVSIVMLSSTIAQALDPCKPPNYKTIDDVYRSTKYQLQQGDVAMCDNTLAEGWYRFTSKAGGKMPEEKVPPKHCGTYAPVWISDTHPTTKGQEKEVTVCTNVRDLLNGCTFKSKISIKHCGSFFVYKLKRLYGCPRAYCAGDQQPCPKGQVGMVPNCQVTPVVDFPSSLVPFPTVTYGWDAANDLISMKCQFKFPNWKNVSFGIEWFNDGYSIKNDTICIDQTKADCSKRNVELPLKNYFGTFYFKPGRKISCSLRMKYNTNTNNTWSAITRKSNQYYIGIEVIPDNNGRRLKECDGKTKVTVKFKPTIPIVAKVSGHLPIKVIVPSKHARQSTKSVVSSCEIKLLHGMTPEHDPYNLTISPECDNVNRPDHSLAYRFTIQNIGNADLFWWAYQLPAIKITVENTHQHECHAVTDPHYYTFDGRYYDFMPIGDYILYKNTRTDTEVHTRSWGYSWWSNGHPTLNCGIAIREGNDIIILNACNNELRVSATMLRREIRSHNGVAPGTHVYRETPGGAVTHKVFLPSGTRIKVERYYWGMSVFIKAFNVKPDTVTGLCGNLNGDPNDEFNIGRNNKQCGDVNCYGESWRLEPHESNFNLYPQATIPTDKIKWCECRGDNFDDCKWDLYNFQQFQQATKEAMKDIVDTLQGTRRRRRSIDDSPAGYTDDVINHEDTNYFVDEQEEKFAFARIRSKRAAPKIVMSKDNATSYCKAIVEDSKAGKTCSKVPGFNLTSAMTECVTDLQFTGDLDFAGAAFDSMKEGCEDVALKNASLYKKDENGKLQPPAEIGDNLCPGDCSHHGNCTNRTCICEEGFTSNDCSMDINAVPELLGIYDGGLCDIRRKPCMKTNIFGKDFIDSENLTCHIREFKVVPTNWIPTPTVVTKPAEMIDIFGVRCDLPKPPIRLTDYDSQGTPAAGLWISISNDGEHRSQRQMRFISYDSVCMVCNKTGNCTMKENACLINGHCFNASQWNPRDWCQQCMPGEGKHSWTKRKDNKKPTFEREQKDFYALLGEDLPIQLKATDPDNRPVKYSLVSSTASRGYTLSSNGLLQGNVTSQADFTVQVKDECNATDTITITVHVVRCPCKNDGQCSPHPYYPRGSGQYSCQCPSGFNGTRCEMNIDDCVSVNCGNGTCLDGINSFKCRCNVGFMGSLCNQMIYKCTNETCYPGVECNATASGITCGPCPVGMSGDGKTCTAPTTTALPTTTQEPSTETTSPTEQTTPTTTALPTTTKEPSTETTSPTEQTTPTTTALPTTTKEPSTETTSPTEQTTPATTTALPTTTKEPSTETTSPTEQTTPTTTALPTTTKEPSTETTLPTKQTKVEAEFRLKMNWTKAYEDKESHEYIALSGRIEIEVKKSYKEVDDNRLVDVKVLALRQGSIIVDLELFFTHTSKDPLSPLKSSAKDGTLGSLPVFPDSIKMKRSQATDKPKKETNILVIVVPIVVIAVFIIFIAITVIVCRGKQVFKYRSRKQSSVCEEDIELNDERSAEKIALNQE